jgi:hypothetical protein
VAKPYTACVRSMRLRRAPSFSGFHVSLRPVPFHSHHFFYRTLSNCEVLRRISHLKKTKQRPFLSPSSPLNVFVSSPSRRRWKRAATPTRHQFWVAPADLLLVNIEAEASSTPLQPSSTVEVKVHPRRCRSIWGEFVGSAPIRGGGGGGLERAEG